jgi:phosphatidylglycerophosphatase A
VQKIFRHISTLFFVGYIPIAPGTFGTIAALLVYLILPKYGLENPWFFIIPLLLVLPAIVFTGEAEKIMKKDDKRIVLDEFIGYFFAVLFLPKTLMIGLLAFILFRIFDIIKPEPINRMQNWKGGIGIVADDIMAGIYANLLLQIGYFLYVLYN